MSLLDALVFRPVLLAIHAADIFTQSFSVAGLIPSGLTLSSGPSKHKIPKHVAFSLVISDQGKLGELKRRSRHEAGRQGRNNVPKPQESQSPSGNKGKEKETCEQAEYKEELSALESQALLSTVQQVVRWAAARDISEISIWNEDGLLDKYLESLVSLLAERPPTPPASGTSSPPPYNRQRGQNRPRQPADSHTAFPANTPTGVSSPDVQSSWIRVDPPLLTETESQFLLHTQDADEALDNFTASRSFTVWPDLENIMEGYDTCKLSSSSSLSRLPSSETTGSLLTDTTARKPVNVHVLARDAGDPMMAHITKKLIADGVPSERVSQQIVEQMVQEQLHFQHDPCLIVVQPLAIQSSFIHQHHPTRRTMLNSSSLPLTYRLLKTVMPPDPPQLHGYPFWPLRVTEIYQSPVSNRIPSRRLPSSAHRSRWGGSKESSDIAGPEVIDRMSWASWDYGIERWQGVEQRLGR